MILTPETLNADCTCISLDRTALNSALNAEVDDVDFCARLEATHPTLLSNLPVFLSAAAVARMAEIIAAIEAIARHPAYVEAALAAAPLIARYQPGPIGVFMGYDFHMGADGPQLIEVNTNAGGGLINAFLGHAQKACCVAVDNLFASYASLSNVDGTFLDAFTTEWRRQRAGQRLTSIAIVDRDPASQFLHPEFVLFQRLFERHGITGVIAAPEQLTYRDGQLWSGSQVIDLVYNRSTDFALEAPDHLALREAYLAGDVVLTPNPRVHALFADKRNLVPLTDRKTLERWGIAAELIDRVERGIPKTVLVTPEQADALWVQRNQLFFKPAGGYASKAAYRGDKITRKVWQSILEGRYIAQALVPPSTRTVVIDGERQVMKVDIRNYTYDGVVQMLAARLYQGQTTNFRTRGGGFAPVFWQRPGGSIGTDIPAKT